MSNCLIVQIKWNSADERSMWKCGNNSLLKLCIMCNSSAVHVAALFTASARSPSSAGGRLQTEDVMLNTTLFAFTRSCPVMRWRNVGSRREANSQTSRTRPRSGLSGQCWSHTVEEKKLLAQAHLTLQPTAPRCRHPYVSRQTSFLSSRCLREMTHPASEARMGPSLWCVNNVMVHSTVQRLSRGDNPTRAETFLSLHTPANYCSQINQHILIKHTHATCVCGYVPAVRLEAAV